MSAEVQESSKKGKGTKHVNNNTKVYQKII